MVQMAVLALRIGRHKQKIVTVKPTQNWRRYLFEANCLGPEVDAQLEADLGTAQFKECGLFKNMAPLLDSPWSKTRFLTGLSFLKQFCRWTKDDCKNAVL